MPHAPLAEQTVRRYLDPVLPFLDDDTVSEIMINRYDEVFIERGGRLERTDVRFPDEAMFLAAVRNVLQFSGRSLEEADPLLDGRLPDGSRVHIVRPPCARRGTAMSIRKFARQMLDIDWLVELGTLTDLARRYLEVAVAGELNLLICGGTSSGKTSLLNALSRFIPDDQRIVVIEDTAELQLQKRHVIALEARPAEFAGRPAVTIRDLFRSSLRLRPDRLIIGEVRGSEALDMIQAMTCGHGGSLGTLHADTPLDALHRLETLAMLGGVELASSSLRVQIASAIDVIVQMARQLDGRRLITRICELVPAADPGEYALRDLFTLQPPGSDDPAQRLALKWTGQPSAMTGRLHESVAPLLVPPVKTIFT